MPVVQHHWQSVESAAFRSWPFKIPSGGLRTSRSPLASEASGEPVQGCRTKAMVAFLSDAPAWPRFLPRRARSYALARESPPVTLREGALKKGSWLVQGFAYTFVCNSAGSGPSDPMSALEGAPGCVGAVRGGCAIFSYFH